MSIEELATMLGEQIMAARAEAWDEGNLSGGYWGTSLTRGPYDPDPPSDNPYRKVSA